MTRDEYKAKHGPWADIYTHVDPDGKNITIGVLELNAAVRAAKINAQLADVDPKQVERFIAAGSIDFKRLEQLAEIMVKNKTMFAPILSCVRTRYRNPLHLRWSSQIRLSSCPWHEAHRYIRLLSRTVATVPHHRYGTDNPRTAIQTATSQPSLTMETKPMTMMPVPFPLMSTDANDPIPHKYVSIKRTQECACCHLIHEWCEVYSYTELRSTMGYKRVQNLRALNWPKYRLPIEQWEDETTVLIPFCHDCNEPSLMNSANMLDPPPTEHRSVLHLYSPPPKAKPSKRPAQSRSPKPVDTLMDMLK